MKRTTRFTMTSALLVLTALATGCLVDETTYTVHLDPDGHAAVMILQQGVRSTDKDRTAGEREEQDFLDRARANDTPKARALRELGATQVSTTVVRDRRPFAVLYEADLGPIDEIARRFLTGLDTGCEVELIQQPATNRLQFSCPEESGDEVDENSDLLSLIGEPGEYRIVSTRGKFVESAGFRLSQDDTVAVPLELEESGLSLRDGRVDYVLAWE